MYALVQQRSGREEGGGGRVRVYVVLEEGSKGGGLIRGGRDQVAGSARWSQMQKRASGRANGI